MNDDSAANERQDLVIGPGGPRPRDRVRHVGSGEAVRIDETGTAVIVPEEPADLGGVDEMVVGPGGYRHRSLVHHIAHGNVLDVTGGRHRQRDPAGRVVADYGVIAPRPGGQPLMPANVAVPSELTAALGTGWIVNTGWRNTSGQPISRFSTTWKVPCEPRTRSGQLVFLFSGIQNSTMIYQPVLQWGGSAAGGGEYWAVASWYADGKGGLEFHSDLVRVEVGDTLVGVMEMTKAGPGDLYDYTCYFQGIDHTTLGILRVEELTWANETMEAYRLTRCSDYPDTDKNRFYNIQMQTGSARTGLSWSANDRITDCGQHVAVVSSSDTAGEVDLWFRSADTSTRVPAGAQVGVVSRSTDKMDVFVTDTDGVVRTAAWQPGGNDAWRGWWSIDCARPPAGAPVNVVSRSTDKLDVFATDADGRVSTAAWEPDVSGWRGWWQVLTGAAAAGAPVTCVSRSKDKLDVFVVGVDGHVWTAAWEQDIAGWRGWWRIGDVSCPAGAPVHAVSRSTDKIDIFVTDVHGKVQTAAWEPSFGSQWHGWWQVAGGAAAPGAAVTAVSRSTDKLDAFVVGVDGHVWTAAWEADIAGWRGWWQIGDLSCPAGAAVHAVSRSRDKLDIFATDVHGVVKTAAWEPSIAGWRGWWEINGGRATPGAPVTAVSRSTDKLDVFVAGTDGRVMTAAWEPDIAGWRGWWPIGG